MAVSPETRDRLARKFAALFSHLDERQQRLLMGAEARMLGHGGIRAVAQAAGTSETRVRRGLAEVEAGERPLGRVRKPGAGRRRAVAADPDLRPALLAMMEPGTDVDPQPPLWWTTRSTRTLARALAEQGHIVSADTVADLLRAEGFSLHANARSLAGRRHLDRDGQFRYINAQARRHLVDGQPVISVQTRRKRKAGDLSPAGQMQLSDQASRQRRTPDTAEHGNSGRAGSRPGEANAWVEVDGDHDTATFAVGLVRRWWRTHGFIDHEGASRLLVAANIGVAGGHGVRAWQTELSILSAETGLDITVCHVPPGTSRWSQIGHRMSCHVVLNWRGWPLVSHDATASTVASTTTDPPETIRAEFDDPDAVGLPSVRLRPLALARHAFYGAWNYTVHPWTGSGGASGD